MEKRYIEFDFEEYKIIEYSAKKQGLSVEDFVKDCIYADLFLSGNFVIIKKITNKVKQRIKERFFRYIKEGEKVEDAENRT